MDEQTKTIQDLLKEAQAALAEGDADKAKQLYREASTLTSRGSELYEQVLAGMRRVRELRAQAGAGSRAQPSEPTALPILALPMTPKPVPNLVEEQLGEASYFVTPQAPREPSTPPLEESTSFENESTRGSSIQDRISDLHNQARSFLNRRTDANYKEAIARYEQILGFSELTDEQRQHYQALLESTRNQREEFLALYGELTTARQLADDERQLIATRKLMNAGKTIDPDGEELQPRFNSLLGTYRQKLVRSAGERAAIADKLVTDGRNLLDTGPIKEAQAIYNEAIQQVKGEQIGQIGQPLEKADIATTIAIEGLRNLLVSHPDTEKAVHDYTERRTRAESQAKLVGIVLILFEKAEKFYEKEQYSKAVEPLEVAQQRSREGFSMLVDSLLTRAQSKWERKVLVEADALLAQLETAFSQGEFSRVEQLADKVLKLEPQLKSDELENRKEKANAILKRLRESEEELKRLVQESRRAYSRDIADAIRLAREALAIRPADKKAQKAFDRALETSIKRLIQAADSSINERDKSKLEAAQTTLAEQQNHVGEIHKGTSQTQLNRRLTRRIERIGEVLAELKKEQEDREEAARVLERCQEQIANEQYPEADKLLAEARQLDPKNIELDEIEKLLRDGWIDHEKEQARRFLAINKPNLRPNVKAAIECLDTLHNILRFEDETTINYRRQANLLQAKEDGLKLKEQGKWVKAIAQLEQADLTDREVKEALRECRRNEAQRLITQRDWQKALDILANVEANDPEFKRLVNRAQAEWSLEQADAARAKKEFELAEQELNKAEQQDVDDENLKKRLSQLRARVTAERKTFDKVNNYRRNATSSYARYEMSKDRRELRKAIEELDNVLALPESELPTNDVQRREVAQLRADYSQRYEQVIQRERTRLLEEGDRALQQERFDDAIQYYSDVLKLQPNSRDLDAEQKLKTARQELSKWRQRLADEASKLLNKGQRQGNKRAIKPDDVTALLSQLQAAQAMDHEVHQNLNQAVIYIIKAQTALSAAESELSRIRQVWIDARSRDHFDFRATEHLFTQADKLFEAHTYQHDELDRNSPSSLRARFKADQNAHQKIETTSQECKTALGQKDRETLQASFNNLKGAEEEVREITTVLQPDHAMSLSTEAERYPKQLEVVRLISRQIKELERQEKDASTIDKLRTTHQQTKQLRTFLEELDPDDRFGLRTTDERGLDRLIERAPKLERAYQNGKALLEQAHSAKSNAEYAQSASRWSEAAQEYRGATQNYTAAIEQLNSPAEEIGPTELKTLKSIGESAQKKRQEAQENLKALEDEKRVRICENKAREAEEIMSKAESRFEAGEPDEARRLASQARDLDLSLSERANKLLRKIKYYEEPASSSLTGLVVFIVLLLTFVLLALFFGPRVWELLNDIVFPSSFLFPQFGA